jgi:hypothetical protein
MIYLTISLVLFILYVTLLYFFSLPNTDPKNAQTSNDEPLTLPLDQKNDELLSPFEKFMSIAKDEPFFTKGEQTEENQRLATILDRREFTPEQADFVRSVMNTGMSNYTSKNAMQNFVSYVIHTQQSWRMWWFTISEFPYKGMQTPLPNKLQWLSMTAHEQEHFFYGEPKGLTSLLNNPKYMMTNFCFYTILEKQLPLTSICNSPTSYFNRLLLKHEYSEDCLRIGKVMSPNQKVEFAPDKQLSEYMLYLDASDQNSKDFYTWYLLHKESIMNRSYNKGIPERPKWIHDIVQTYLDYKIEEWNP